MDKIYVIVIESCNDGVYTHDLFKCAYTDKEDAVAKVKQLFDVEKRQSWLSDYNEDEYHLEECDYSIAVTTFDDNYLILNIEELML